MTWLRQVPHRVIDGRVAYVYRLLFGQGRLALCDESQNVVDQW